MDTVKVNQWGRPTCRSLITSDGSMMLKLREGGQHMLNMTLRGRHWRLYDSEIQKGGKPILCDIEYDSEKQTLPSCMVFNMTERGKHCNLRWRWGWYRETNSAILCGAEYNTERQSLPSCVMLNTTERQTQMEVCEEMMRGMPRCSKQEWRHKRD